MVLDSYIIRVTDGLVWDSAYCRAKSLAPFHAVPARPPTHSAMQLRHLLLTHYVEQEISES
jgi:hypothetical protein